MPTRDGYPEGVPSWVDLGTPNLEGAQEFYSKLFGWEYYDGGSESMPYMMATKNGLAAAGIGPIMDESMPSVWSAYFAVDSADGAVEKIKAAGGSVIMECMDVFDSGRMAFGADPTGAAFGVWEAKEHKGAGIVNEHGALNWTELQTNDVEGALPFYEAVFGHTHQTAQMPNGGPYTSISVGDRVIAGAMTMPVPDVPNYWAVYFAVDSTEAAVETAKAGGGATTYGPMEIPEVGVFGGLVDPYGAHFNVIQLASAVD